MPKLAATMSRSEMMSRIGSKDTKPELVVRRGLHAQGYRYRLHNRKLPGKPDIVFSKYRAVIFVHGCFWHAHENCKYFRLPKSNAAFWQEKLRGNRDRDQISLRRLKESGWRVMIVWECATRKLPTDRVIDTISNWLLSDRSFFELYGNAATTTKSTLESRVL